MTARECAYLPAMTSAPNPGAGRARGALLGLAVLMTLHALTSLVFWLLRSSLIERARNDGYDSVMSTLEALATTQLSIGGLFLFVAVALAGLVTSALPKGRRAVGAVALGATTLSFLLFCGDRVLPEPDYPLSGDPISTGFLLRSVYWMLSAVIAVVAHTAFVWAGARARAATSVVLVLGLGLYALGIVGLELFGIGSSLAQLDLPREMATVQRIVLIALRLLLALLAALAAFWPAKKA